MLDLTKPMQTKDGRKVLDFYVFKDKKTYPLVCLIEGDTSVLSFDMSGRHVINEDCTTDLINVPEPVQFWDCPDDVPKDRLLWMRHINWHPGNFELVNAICCGHIRVANTDIGYSDLKDWRWLDFGEWKECVKG